jgi:hypothetical protein
MLLRLFQNVNRNAALQKKRIGNCNVSADSCWEMLLKLLDSRWEMLRGCRKAAGKCPKAIGKPLGNS